MLIAFIIAEWASFFVPLLLASHGVITLAQAMTCALVLSIIAVGAVTIIDRRPS